VLTVLACAAQVIVLLATLVVARGLGNLLHVAAVVQAGLAFVLIARLAARRLGVVVLVPVLSAALSAALAFTGLSQGRATACSDEERAVAQQVAPPPGTSVEFEGTYSERCLARSRMRLSNQAILEHYEAEFTRLGWQESAGREPGRVATAAAKDGITMYVEIRTGDEGSAEAAQRDKDVVISVSDAGR
jgi:hypothetical protein